MAVMDASRAAACSLRDELAPDASVFDDLDTMLDATRADAAIVCTPTHLHYEHTLSCLDHGLHVLCEKPLADTRERIVELIERSASAGRHLCVAYQRRFQSAFRTMRREVRSGKWGAVRAISSHNYENWQQGIAGTWRDDERLNPGGFIGDAGSHKIDYVFYVTGLKPVEVYARCDNCSSHVAVVAAASALLSGGVPWNIDFVGNAQNLGEDMYVHCADADFIMRDGRLWIGRPGNMELMTNLEADSNPNAGFVDLLRGDGENIAPPDCALPVYDFTRAMFESSRLGHNVVIT